MEGTSSRPATTGPVSMLSLFCGRCHFLNSTSILWTNVCFGFFNVVVFGLVGLLRFIAHCYLMTETVNNIAKCDLQLRAKNPFVSFLVRRVMMVYVVQLCEPG
jgi:hypothetical protein